MTTSIYMNINTLRNTNKIKVIISTTTGISFTTTKYCTSNMNITTSMSISYRISTNINKCFTIYNRRISSTIYIATNSSTSNIYMTFTTISSTPPIVVLTLHPVWAALPPPNKWCVIEVVPSTIILLFPYTVAVAPLPPA